LKTGESYIYAGNNPVMFIDKDGREKLIYYFIPTIDALHASMYPDDKNIHIFTHSTSEFLRLNIYEGNEGARVTSGRGLDRMLSTDSETWQNKSEAGNFAIIIHGCNVANGESGMSLAEKISGSPEFKDQIIIAPDKKSFLANIDGLFKYKGIYAATENADGRQDVDYSNKGNWIVLQNGVKIDEIPGDVMPKAEFNPLTNEYIKYNERPLIFKIEPYEP
jgi:hypothetical protein